eukprot:TRINITY_DN9750_c1_g1_i3.p1 TRINITY_DN9750_c1_g1~~TRINITY_DN9750_c1_g1_i3.p1  ORF type:complete len:354 (+),score=59.22 TRINITY_DN9750_c1_g1_i3:102-1163(+)
MPTSRELVFVATFGMGSFLFSMITVMETILVMHLAYKCDANWFHPVGWFRTLRNDVSETADWTLLLQYMEKRVNPPVKRTSTILMSLQSIRRRGGGGGGGGGVRAGEEIDEEKDKEEECAQSSGVQSSSCSNQAENSESVPTGRREWRHQDSCTVHRDNRYAQTIFEEEEGEDEIEFYESCSDADKHEYEIKQKQSPFHNTHTDEREQQQQPHVNNSQNSSGIGDTVFHRTAEEARRFVDRLLKMEIPSKGSPALQRAARRALARHGYAKLEHRLLGILGHEDIASALRRIDPRSYQNAMSSEYNLRWQSIGRLVDNYSQWMVVIGYFLFCFITYTIVLIQSQQTPHDKIFDL